MKISLLIYCLIPLCSIAQNFTYEVPELPDELTFASEEVPLQRPEVRENLMKELIARTYYHTTMLQTSMQVIKYGPMIKKILKEENVPEDMFYLAVIESELEPDAVSYAEAVGIWQLLKPTAKELGLIVTDHIDQRKDPELSTVAAAKYLKKAYENFGSWALAISSYNRGMTGVSDALNKQKVKSFYDLYLHPQSAKYIYRALAAKIVMENDQKYAVNKDKFREIVIPADYKTIEVSKDIESLPDFAKEHGTNYKILKELNPWMVNTDYRLVIPEGITLNVKIPK